MYANAAHFVNTPSTSTSSLSPSADTGTPDMDPRLALSALQLARKIKDQHDPLTSRVCNCRITVTWLLHVLLLPHIHLFIALTDSRGAVYHPDKTVNPRVNCRTMGYIFV